MLLCFFSSCSRPELWSVKNVLALDLIRIFFCQYSKWELAITSATLSSFYTDVLFALLCGPVSIHNINTYFTNWRIFHWKTIPICVPFCPFILLIEYFILMSVCRLSLKNIAYIGLRSVDPMERLIAEKFNIKMLGMDVSFRVIFVLNS